MRTVTTSRSRTQWNAVAMSCVRSAKAPVQPFARRTVAPASMPRTERSAAPAGKAERSRTSIRSTRGTRDDCAPDTTATKAPRALELRGVGQRELDAQLARHALEIAREHSPVERRRRVHRDAHGEDRRAALGAGAGLRLQIGHVDAVLCQHARDARHDARLVDASHGARQRARRSGRTDRQLAVEGAEEHGQPLLPLEPLARGRQALLHVGPLAGEQQQHGELVPEDGHARILEVAVALEDQLGEIGHDAGPVAPDGGEGEPAPHLRAFRASPRTYVSAFSRIAWRSAKTMRSRAVLHESHDGSRLGSPAPARPVASTTKYATSMRFPSNA